MPSKNKAPDSELVLLTRKYNRMIYQCKGMVSQLSRMQYQLPMPAPGVEQRKLLTALAEAQNHLEYCEHLTQVLSAKHRDQLKDMRLKPGLVPVTPNATKPARGPGATKALTSPGLDPASCQVPQRRKDNAK